MTCGHRGVYVFRRIEGERARYYPEDAKYLLEFEPRVTHYEVLVASRGGAGRAANAPSFVAGGGGAAAR